MVEWLSSSLPSFLLCFRFELSGFVPEFVSSPPVKGYTKGIPLHFSFYPGFRQQRVTGRFGLIKCLELQERDSDNYLRALSVFKYNL